MAVKKRRRTKGYRRDQAALVLAILKEHYGPAECTLDFADDPWRLLVGGILAAQCTDERVNKVTPSLFERYPTVQDMALAQPEEIEPYIKSCGLYRNKAKGIHGSALKIVTAFGGQVPAEQKALQSLPGVGRKIANLLIGDAFGGQAIVVDTHCGRIARLLGLTKETDPLKVERDLLQFVPPTEQTAWGHYLVTHGRACCQARKPDCDRCPIAPCCDTGIAAGIPVHAALA